jgi:hypothetical protein
MVLAILTEHTGAERACARPRRSVRDVVGLSVRARGPDALLLWRS